MGHTNCHATTRCSYHILVGVHIRSKSERIHNLEEVLQDRVSYAGCVLFWVRAHSHAFAKNSHLDELSSKNRYLLIVPGGPYRWQSHCIRSKRLRQYWGELSSTVVVSSSICVDVICAIVETLLTVAIPFRSWSLEKNTKRPFSRNTLW